MKIFIKYIVLIYSFFVFIDAQDNPYFAKNGIVVSASQLASQIGVDIMKSGGNAIMTKPKALSDSLQIELENRGHEVIPYKWGYLGSANGILINEDGYYDGPDPRGENALVIY